MTHPVQPRHDARAPRGTVLRSLSLAAGIGFLSLALGPATSRQQDPVDDTTGQVELTREALEQLIEAKRLIAQEKRDWAEGKELLQDRIEVVRGNIEGLRKQIEEAEANIRDTDQKRADLGAQHEALEAAAAQLRGVATELEGRMRALMPQLPEMLQEKVRPLVLRFPADSADTKLSLGQRFGTIAGILQEVDKFNLAVHVANEVRTLKNGKTAEVGVLYLGLGQAYVANADGTYAEVGVPGAEGWTWTSVEDPKDAEQIHLAIQIARGDQGASYTLVPASVR